MHFAHKHTRTTECRGRKTLSKGIKIKNLALKVKKKKKQQDQNSNKWKTFKTVK